MFDTFHDEQGRQQHLNGRIAAGLMSIVDLLGSPPTITPVDLLGSKIS